MSKEKERKAEYLNLLQALLNSSNDKQKEILVANQHLIDGDLIQNLMQIVEEFTARGEENAAHLLNNIVFELIKYLITSNTPPKLPKTRADRLLVRLFNQGIQQFKICQFTTSLQSWETALKIYREIGDRKAVGASLGSLSNLYLSLGQDQKALHYSEEGLAIARKISVPQYVVKAFLNTLGNAYLSLGQDEKAIDYYQQSLALAREIKDRESEAKVLGNLGNAYLSLGQYEKAIDYYQQSLALAREIKDRESESGSLNNWGVVYTSLGQYEKAIDYYQQSLVLAREIKDRKGEANSLGNLGNAYQKSRQIPEAIIAYQDSLKIATPNTMPRECFKFGSNLGNLAFTQGDWELAISGYAPAIEAAEKSRGWETSDQSREEILKQAISAYMNIVQCHINLQQYEQALEYVERSRSRFLVDLMASNDLYSGAEIPEKVQKLLEEYQAKQQQIDSIISHQSYDFQNRGLSVSLFTPQQQENLEKSPQQLQAEKQSIWLEIRKEDPVLSGQIQVDPLKIEKMQRLLEQPTTAVLSFFTTTQDTHIFILRQTENKQYQTLIHTCVG